MTKVNQQRKQTHAEMFPDFGCMVKLLLDLLVGCNIEKEKKIANPSNKPMF